MALSSRSAAKTKPERMKFRLNLIKKAPEGFPAAVLVGYNSRATLKDSPTLPKLPKLCCKTQKTSENLQMDICTCMQRARLLCKVSCYSAYLCSCSNDKLLRLASLRCTQPASASHCTLERDRPDETKTCGRAACPRPTVLQAEACQELW